MVLGRQPKSLRALKWLPDLSQIQSYGKLNTYHPHRYLTFDNPVDAAGFIDGLEDSIILDDAVANYVSVVTKKRFMQWLNI